MQRTGRSASGRGGLREAARILDVTITEEKKDDLRDDEFTRAATGLR